MRHARAERLLGIIAVLLLAAALVAFLALAADREGTGATASAGPQGPTERAEVIGVVDGDTIVARVGGREERVRYIGMDAPESANSANGTAAECGGEDSRTANQSLVAGEEVVLERDVSERDRFGRLLRHVWLEQATWRLIGLELVEAGMAHARSYPPDTGRDADMLEAAARARDRGTGIWGDC